MEVNRAIFKAYDVRGRFPNEINETQVYTIARAFILLLKSRPRHLSHPRIVIARDARLSSPLLIQAAIRGLMDEGAEVIDMAIATTPFFGWVVFYQQADGGVMITASHNAQEYNGMKFLASGGEAIGETNGLLDIYHLCGTASEAVKSQGMVVQRDFLLSYTEFLSHGFSFLPMRVVVDASNGCTPPVLYEVFQHFPQVQVIRLNWNINGHFPAHGPDPLRPGATDQAGEAVRDKGAQVGAVFDADGDRVAFLDDRGFLIRPDLVTAFIASRLLKTHKMAKIIYNVPSSRTVKEVILENGGIPLESRVGHFFIKQLMRHERALFAGEHSGHYFFERMGYSWGAVFALLEILQILSTEKEKLSILLEPFRRYVPSGEVSIEGADWEFVKKRMMEVFPDAHFYYADGLSVEYPDWWCNIRTSHTESYLRLNMEAKTEELLEEKLALVKALLVEPH